MGKLVWLLVFYNLSSNPTIAMLKNVHGLRLYSFENPPVKSLIYRLKIDIGHPFDPL
jgi:hypothetical protein